MRFEVLKNCLEFDGISHTVYGIECIDEENIRHTFAELTHKLEAAQGFVNDLNELQPDFSQLEYIIEDFYIGQN